MNPQFPAYVEVAPGRFRERYGLDFEDFEVGQVFKHRPGITLSQQDNTNEALDTLNQAMIHFDAHYAAQTEFKHPLVVSTLTVKRLIGMTWKTFNRRKRILGWQELSMSAPVYAGDTLYAQSEVLEVHPESPDPQCGLLLLRTSGINQRGETCCRMVYQALIYKREQLPFAEHGY